MAALDSVSENGIGTWRVPKGSRVSVNTGDAASARDTSSTRTVSTASGGIAMRCR